MDTRELSADDVAALAEDCQAWWASRAGVWHAVGAPEATRCGLAVEEPPFHYQQVVADAAGNVQVCGTCLAALDAEDEPATVGELLVEQFRLYHVE